MSPLLVLLHAVHPLLSLSHFFSLSLLQYFYSLRSGDTRTGLSKKARIQTCKLALDISESHNVPGFIATSHTKTLFAPSRFSKRKYKYTERQIGT